jgi:hypothetical protein
MNLTTKTALSAIAAAVLGTLGSPGSASAAEVSWTQWTSAVAGTNGRAFGQMVADDGSSISVSYSGQLAFWDAPGSNSFWQDGGGTYTSAAVDNGPGDSGMVALSRLGTRTLTFSQSVGNVFFALIGLNAVGYEFDQDFTIESSGPGHLGSGSFSKQITADGKYRLTGSGEPHGVIRFVDLVTTIRWTSLADEQWNGFTVGTYGAAPVPESSTWALMGLGLFAMGCFRRRRCATA